jgi:hypothetical protein
MFTAPVQVGRHSVCPGVYFDVRQFDDGTLLTLFDEREGVNRRYTLLFDAQGVKHREVTPIDPAADVGTQPPPTVAPTPPSPENNQFFGPRKLVWKGPSDIRLQVQLPDPKTGALAFRSAWVHGGYRQGRNMILLVQYTFRQHVHDGLVRIVDGKFRVMEHVILEADRLLPEDWGKFLALPGGAKFKVSGQTWEKVTATDLGQFKGKRLWPMPVIGDSQDARY